MTHTLNEPLSPDIGLKIMASPITGERLWRFGQQVSYAMQQMQQGFYMAPRSAGGLQLERTDTDAPPDPHDPRDVYKRVAKYLDYGTGNPEGVIPIGAFRRDEAGALSEAIEGIEGFSELHRRDGWTEIYELNIIRAAMRGQGLGTALMRASARLIPPGDPVSLDVSWHNHDAIDLYYHWGFRRNSQIQAKDHGVFKTHHIQMETYAADLQDRLGVEYAPGIGFAA